MLKDRVFLFSLLVLFLLAAIHHIGLARNWYYTMPSLDLITHFLGGLWITLVVLWLIFRSGYIRTIPYSKKSAALVALGTVAVIGVLWELFELWAGIIIQEGYVLDTVLDGVMDALGALAGFSFFAAVQADSISLSQ